MAFNFAKYAQQQANGQLDPAEPLSRQVNLILAQLDDDVVSAGTRQSYHPILVLQSAQIIRRLSDLANTGSQLASASLSRISTKANALVTSHVARTQALTVGYSLGLEIAGQTQWSDAEEYVVARYGTEWISAILTYLAVTSGQAPPSASLAKGQDIRPDPRVLDAALRLALDHILSPVAQSRPEYARAVVTPNLPRIAGTMVTSMEAIVKRSCCTAQEIACFQVLVTSVTRHLESHPSTYRPFVSRLHVVASPIVTAPTSSPVLVRLATKLLGSLYLTGAISSAAGRTKELAGSVAGGKASQAQLWQATISAALASTREAWAACVSTFDTGRDQTARLANKDKLPFAETLDQDSQDVAEARLDRLLGGSSTTADAPSEDGVLLQLLQTPTRKAVPLALNALFSLALHMLAVTPETPAKAAVESSVHALQAMRLPMLHLRALRLLRVLVRITKASGTAAIARFGPVVLDRLVRLIEGRHSSASGADLSTPSVRAAASQVMAQVLAEGQAVPLDPSSRLVVRASRVCLAEISQLLVSSASASTSSQAGAPRAKQLSRKYESDALLSTSSSGRFLFAKSAEEQASAIACLSAFPALYAHLSTSLTPTHYDLAHSGVQLTLAVTELLVRASQTATSSRQTIAHWSMLTAASLQSLTALVSHSSASTPFLSLLVTRASHLADHARNAVGLAHPAVGSAAQALSVALKDAIMPRLPPVLATQVDVATTEQYQEEDGRGGWELDAETGREAKSATGPVRGSSDGAVESAALSSVGKALKEVAGVEIGHVHMDVQPPQSTTVVEAVGVTAPWTSTPIPTQPAAYTGPRHSSPARTDHTRASSPSGKDPVKPLHRPSTPKLGTSPSRSASATHIAPGSPEAKEIFGGGGGGGATTALAASPSLRSSMALPATTRSGGGVPAGLAIDIGEDGQDDSDEEMPEIDLRSSDEEDEEEGEEEE